MLMYFFSDLNDLLYMTRFPHNLSGLHFLTDLLHNFLVIDNNYINPFNPKLKLLIQIYRNPHFNTKQHQIISGFSERKFYNYLNEIKNLNLIYESYNEKSKKDRRNTYYEININHDYILTINSFYGDWIKSSFDQNNI